MGEGGRVIFEYGWDFLVFFLLLGKRGRGRLDREGNFRGGGVGRVIFKLGGEIFFSFLLF